MDAELEALQTMAAWVRDLVLDEANGPSSLVAPLSPVVEPLGGRIDAAAANGVCWGTWSALVASLSHFSGLTIELELLGFGHNAVLAEDQVDALWIQACPASDSLASFILPSVARGSPDGARE
jgi:hypothetical protein